MMTPTPTRSSPHPLGNRLARVAWGVVQATVFRLSPRPMHRWRNLLLRAFGAQLHPTARVYPRAKIWGPWNLRMGPFATIADDVDVYSVAEISIGEATTVSQYSYLCTASHDYDRPEFPLFSRPIRIGARVWIAADCYLAPGVVVHDGAVVGARSGVFADLDPWTVNVGTPCRKVRERRRHESQENRP